MNEKGGSLSNDQVMGAERRVKGSGRRANLLGEGGVIGEGCKLFEGLGYGRSHPMLLSVFLVFTGSDRMPQFNRS